MGELPTLVPKRSPFPVALFRDVLLLVYLYVPALLHNPLVAHSIIARVPGSYLSPPVLCLASLLDLFVSSYLVLLKLLSPCIL